MNTEGIVFRKKGVMAIIRCERPEACEHCENSAICNKRETELRAYDPVGVSVGDRVEVETREDSRSMLVISYIFLVPVVILFLSYLLFTVLPYLAFGGILLFAVYFIGLKAIDKRFDPQVRIVRIVRRNEEKSEEALEE